MAVLDLVQQATSNFGGSTLSGTVLATLPANLTAGNTLMVVGHHRTGEPPVPTVAGDETIAVTGDPTTGWVQTFHFPSQIANTSARQALFSWYIHTDTLASLASTTWGWFLNSGTPKLAWVMEYEGALELDQISTNDSAAGQVSSLSTGTTPATSVADELIVTIQGIRHGAAGAISWTNSLVNLGTQINGGGADQNASSMVVADKIVSATGTQESTASWTTAEEAAAVIVTFNEVGGAGDQSIAVGAAVETEAVQPIVASGGELVVSVGAVSETETVQAINATLATSLYATATQTIADVVNENDNTTDLHLSVDDDPASPNDNDWVNNAVDVT